MQSWLGLGLIVVACSNNRAAVDAPIADRPSQADANDADAADAMTDARISTSPRCATTPAVLIETTPRVIGNIARAGDTLYVSAYLDDGVNLTDPVVIPIDLTTNIAATPVPLGGAAAVWSAGDNVYATEYIADGTIWQFHPGAAPVALVPHRASPTTATADATYLYWAEGNAIQRRVLAGGTIDPVYSCPSPIRLAVDDSDLYCAASNGDVMRGLKAGGSIPDGIASDSYPITSMIQDGTYLYFVNLIAELYKINTFGSTAALVKKLPPGARFVGMAATSDYFYITDDFEGMHRIDRTAATVELIVPGVGYGQDPVLWHDQLYYEAMNQTDPYERFVMHCVD